MAQVQQQPHSDKDDLTKFHFYKHVRTLPIVQDTLGQAGRIPLANTAGNVFQNVSKAALSFAGPIEPYLERADQFADDSLKSLEEKYPLVKAPTQEIKDKTSGAAKTTVDTYVGAVTDKFSGVSHKAKTNGQKAKKNAEEGAQETKDAALPAITTRVDAVCKPVLDVVEDLLDTYLPKQKKQAKEDAKDAKYAAEGKAEDIQGEAEDVAGQAKEAAEDVGEQAKSTAYRVFDLSTSMLDRSVNVAKQTVHAAGNTVYSAADYAKWGVTHPTQVPSAVANTASANAHALKERIDGTVDVTRSRVHQVTDLVSQAKSETVRVFDSEHKNAPKDQPRGLVLAAISTAFILTREVLDHVTQTIKENADAARERSETLDKAVKKGEEVASQAGEKAGEAKEYASEKSSQAKEYAGDKASQAQGKTKELGEQAHEHVGKPAKHKGQQAKDYTKEQVNQTAEHVKQAADKAKQ